MIRWARVEDQAGILHVLQEAKAGWSGYDYTTMGGQCLVYEHEGEIVGFLLCTIARPDSYIRELAVIPKHQGLGISRDLVSALMAEATVFGSQAIESFEHEDFKTLVKMISRRRIMVERGIRLRVPLTMRTLNACPLATAEQNKEAYPDAPTSWKQKFTPPGSPNGEVNVTSDTTA